MNLSHIITDPYSRRARLAPALLAALPLILIVVFLFPDIGWSNSVVFGVLVYGGGAMFLTQLGRDRGKRIEPRLFEDWGGKPSVAMLRHRDNRLDPVTKGRYRDALEQRIDALTFASAEEEAADPDVADAGYESATAWLLSRTRDRDRYQLLFAENVSYGFRRNLFALKMPAIVMDACFFVVFFFHFASIWQGDILETGRAFPDASMMSAALVVLHRLAFCVIINSDWVRLPADAYARQLLSSLDNDEP